MNSDIPTGFIILKVPAKTPIILLCLIMCTYDLLRIFINCYVSFFYNNHTDVMTFVFGDFRFLDKYFICYDL